MLINRAHNKSLEQSAVVPASTVSLSCLQNCDSLFDSARLLNSMLCPSMRNLLLLSLGLRSHMASSTATIADVKLIGSNLSKLQFRPKV